MNNIFVRTAVVALFAVGSLAALSAEPRPGPKDGSPIPVCYQCGHGNNGN
jgi:hypothetical protein